MSTRFSVIVICASILLSMPASAEDIRFNRGTGDEVSGAIATQFVRPMLELEASAPDPQFAWARADIDADGYDELFIQLLEGPLCNGDDCPVIGYRRANAGNWPAILTTIAASLTIDGAGDKPILIAKAADNTASSWSWNGQAGMMIPAN